MTRHLENRVVFEGKVVRTWASRGHIWARMNYRDGKGADYYVTVWLPEGTDYEALPGRYIRVEGILGSFDFTQPLATVVDKAGGDPGRLPANMRRLQIPRSSMVIIADSMRILDTDA